MALTAGGHTVGKAHGNGSAANLGPAPKGRHCRTGHGLEQHTTRGIARDTVTSGSKAPGRRTRRSGTGGYFDLLLRHEWELQKSPAGAHQWEPVNIARKPTCPDVGTRRSAGNR